mgnify:CR=1 FL=1
MANTAFDTLATRNYRTGEILNKIELAQVEGELVPLFSPAENNRVVGVRGIASTNTDIPAFSHPIWIEGREEFIIDSRTYLKVDGDGNLKISNMGEYRYQLTRAILNRHWLLETPMDLLNLGELPALVFMRWLGGNLARKLGLSPADQVKVNIVTVFYWYSLFRDVEEPFSEKEKLRIATRITQMTSIPSTQIMAVIDTISPMGDLTGYCAQLVESIDNARVEMVSPAFIYALLGGSWFGMNIRETIAVATEHPPTYLAMISEALLNRSYRKTQVGSLVYDNDKRGRGDTFNRNLRNVLEAHYA